MKILLSLILLSLPLFSQSGQVTFTPPAPGKVLMVAGSITCNLTGNAVPATIINVDCNVDGTPINYNVPVNPGKAYTTSFHSGVAGATPVDAITFSFIRQIGGLINWQAAATPAGGVTASGSGNF